MLNFSFITRILTVFSVVGLLSLKTVVSAQTQTLNIVANVGFQATAITRPTTNAPTIRICAGGQIAVWGNAAGCDQSTPSGITRDVAGCSNCVSTTSNLGSLIGRFGNNGIPFFIGERATISSLANYGTGVLWLAVNDQQTLYSDNIGFFVVSIDATANACSNLSNCLLAQGLVGGNDGGNDGGSVVVEENSFALSRIENTNEIGGISIFPNPVVDGNVTFQVNLIEDSNISSIKVHSIDGSFASVIHSGALTKGNHQFTLKLPESYKFKMLIVESVIGDSVQVDKLLVLD